MGEHMNVYKIGVIIHVCILDIITRKGVYFFVLYSFIKKFE